MKYGSVCSGIEAATVAWHQLGWKAAFFSEIERFPRAVLAHHYPDTPCHGDFTTIGKNDYGTIDLLVGGTPCQDFSVAGLRKGLAGERGNLTLEFIRLAERKKPRWLLWENVPGVLSQDNGRAFGSFLGGLAECGYGFSYRILDAQYFGVPQRRRRVFVVGYLGDWRPAAAVLFERESLQGDITPSRETRQEIARCLRGRSNSSHREDSDNFVTDTLTSNGDAHSGFRDEKGLIIDKQWPTETAPTLDANYGSKQGLNNQHIRGGQDYSLPEISMCLNAGAMGRQDAESETLIPTQRGFPDSCGIQANIIDRKPENGGNGFGFTESVSPTLTKADRHAVAYPINTQIATRCEAMGEGTGLGIGANNDPAFTLQAAHHHAVGVELSPPLFSSESPTSIRMDSINKNTAPYVPSNMQVRRLTPTECERLQGFPDNYTKISDKTADGSRYKALGNSMAVPVMRWLGERINLINTTILSNEWAEKAVVGELNPHVWGAE